MKILYADGVTPIFNKHYGYTFQPGRGNQVVMRSQPESRTRYPRQFRRMQHMARAKKIWQQISSGEKNNWDNFAATFPQACQNPDSGFLTGYQNFLKRQYYQELNFSPGASVISTPGMTEIFIDPCTYSVRSSGGELFIDYEFTNWLSDNIVSLFCSYPKSPGLLYQKTQSRYMGFIINTEKFIPNYGRLYNGFCINDPAQFAPENWEIPSYTDFWELGNYLETCFGRFTNSVGGFLKETGFSHWLSPNTGASNSVGFNAVGSGARSGDNGTFAALKYVCNLWNVDVWSTSGLGSHRATSISYSKSRIQTSTYGCSGFLVIFDDNTEGKSIRLINRNPSGSESEVSTMTGNDGQVYPTIVINGIEWMAANSIETKFRDNSDIPLITANADWINATDSAYSDYDNNPENSLIQSNSLNITELYKYNFGLIPASGKHLLFKAVPMAIDNGQFFEKTLDLYPIT